MTLSLSAATLFQLAFYILLLVFVIHAVVLAYHWLSFGASRTVSMTGIAVYLAGGASLVLLLAVSLNFI